MIKAIETEYKGYRFRSRLEARWAVFFDTLDIAWEYEKEGYDLGEAGWYLPDFWLPELGIWIEIKGQNPTKEEELKARMLCEGTKHDVGILSGAPWFNIFRSYYRWRPASTPEELEKMGIDEPSPEDLTEGARDISDWFADPAYDYEKEDGRGCYYQGWLTWGYNVGDPYTILKTSTGSPAIICLTERDEVRAAHAVAHAYYNARAARFEHGQNGAK